MNKSVNQLQVQVQVQDTNQMSAVQDEITSLLRKRHRISDNADDDFNIRDITQIQETAENVTTTLTLFLAGVAMIPLIVGGIGIMNIMLVSVTERTREIGLRMAIGAARQDILNQFLYEAILLSLAGSLFGIVFGLAGTKIFSYFASWSTSISIQAIVLSVAFALVVGVFFGYYPARRASRFNPAEALSFE
ncbi:MAG: FtsX-like permease family protein [Eubacteriales bacterium]|jgi:putative ABC transport system permease protein